MPSFFGIVSMSRLKLVYFLLLLRHSDSKTMDPEKMKFCEEVELCETDNGEVCGIRWEGKRYVFKIFPDECELMRFGCEVEDDKDAYGIIKMDLCNETLLENEIGIPTNQPKIKITTSCIKDCPQQVENETVCGIRKQGEGFKLRLFVNECEILKYNCENHMTFNITDRFLCDDLVLPKESVKSVKQKTGGAQTEFNEKDVIEILDDKNNKTADNGQTINEKYGKNYEIADNGKTINEKDTHEIFGDNGQSVNKETVKRKKVKTIVVVDGNMFDNGGGINDTVNNFFSATHVFDMPLQEVSEKLNQTTRRVMLRTFGPVMVFKPAVVIPKDVKEDVWHKPTLASCYHECPKECPETYTPVCGTPGTTVREPSLMFKNHCYMDAAQCKMRWDNESVTSRVSAYMEASFVFCLGDVLNGLYRFLPLVRTLQHMGRLKKKGKYRIRLRNMRFMNELLQFKPRLQG